MYDLIIIGLGPAGINACIYAKRSNLNVLVIEKGVPGGSLHNIKNVENYLGYEQINGSDLALKFYKQFKELNVPLVNEEVLEIKVSDTAKEIITNSNVYQTKAVIIATGRGPLKLNVPGENLKGVSNCVLCDAALYKNKDVALYGNGPKNLEDAIYLSGIAQNVYLIINEHTLLGAKELKEKVETLTNIHIINDEKIIEIIGKTSIKKIRLKKSTITVDGLFINNGYGPLTYFCRNLNITNEKGYIIVNEYQETAIKGIFACGDSTKKEIYQIITAASEGASSAINAYKYIKGI